MAEDIVRSRPLRMRLDGMQSGIAQRHVRRLLSATRLALPAGRRCRSRGASSPPPFGGIGAAAESRQNAFGDFQFIELISQLCPFSIDPRQPLGNPLLFLPNLVQRRHLVSPSSSPNSEPNTPLSRYSAIDGGLAHRKKADRKKLLLFDGGAEGPAALGSPGGATQAATHAHQMRRPVQVRMGSRFAARQPCGYFGNRSGGVRAVVKHRRLGGARATNRIEPYSAITCSARVLSTHAS